MTSSPVSSDSPTELGEKLRIRYVLTAVLVVVLVLATMWTHHQQHATLKREFYGRAKAFESDGAAAKLLKLYGRTIEDIRGLQVRVFWLLVLTIVVVLGSCLLILEPAARLIERAVKQRDEALRMAREASAHKSQFLANMSHEIRTPMNGIVGMGEILSGTRLDPEQRDYLRLVRESADALLCLLNDILDFSKIEAGKLEFETSSFSLRDCVESTSQVYAAQAAKKGVELSCRIDPSVPDTLLGDPGRFRQVVANLVSNAVKFTESGEVHIECRREFSAGVPDRCVIRCAVQDTGIGIPVEKQQQIFDAFSQADASTTRRFGGTGLGLAISSQLAEMMHGSLDVESEVGQGTTFSFNAEFGLVRSQQHSAEPSAEFAEMTALVVDDNKRSRNVLVETLTGWGIETLAADGGPAGLRLIHQRLGTERPIRLVLVDFLMPDMDGFEFAEQVQQLAIGDDFEGDDCAVVLVSSQIRRGDNDRCRQRNIVRCLAKPVRTSELQRTILALQNPDFRPEVEVADEDCTAYSLKVLLVEDDPINQRVAVEFLQRRGHQVDVVADGIKALDAVSRRSFDAVLMDIHLPEMDGYETAKAIRELKRSGELPIIAMTASAMKGDREQCLEIGMDGYISKPIDRAELLYTLESLTSTKRTYSESALAETPSPKNATKRIKPENRLAMQGRPGKLIDWERALARIPGGDEVARELAQILQKQGPELCGEIAAARKDRDASRMRRAAHTLKGSSAIFEADALVNVASALEEAAKAEQLDQAGPLVDQLISLIPSLREELSEFLQSAASKA